MSLMSLTAVELGRKIKEKEVTVEEAVTAALDAIEKREAQVHSFVTVDREGALKRAKEVQAKINAGELTGPLAGVPVAIKDNMCTKGLLTTCSSKILYNFVPTYTAEAVLNLEKAGAVILGKTNIHGIPGMCRGVRQAVPARRLQRKSAAMRSVPTPAVRSVSRAPSVA